MTLLYGRRRLAATLTRRFSSSSSASKNKVPILYKSPEIKDHNKKDAVTLQLLSWGRGASGQLGGGIEESRLYPAPVANIQVLTSSFTLSPTPGRLGLENHRKSDRKQGAVKLELGISCGLFHSALVLDGNFWIWGKGDGGRLGFGHENPVFVPTLNPNLDPVQSLALGGIHSIALTSLGQVFTWGYGGFGALGHCVYHRELLPRLVEGPWSGKIRHISTSGTHTAVITDTGELYTWGRDEGDGRLGLGPGPGPNEGGGLSVPSKVKALKAPVAAVYCGGFFTTVLTEEGQIWNWGASKNYELGRGDKVGGWRPQSIPSLENVRIIQVASGAFHSLALTDEGRVLSWGFGGHGQLGHSSIESEKIPRVIDALTDQKVVYIACGGSSSAAITDKGKLYMWGNAKDSQLGVPGLPEVQPCPVEVTFLSEDDDLGLFNVISVGIGASHAMCLVLRSSCGIDL